METMIRPESRTGITVPEDIFQRFTSSVPANIRSEVLAQLMEDEVRRRSERLIAACEAANADHELWELEQDFQALPDTMEEPWTGPCP